MSMLNDQYYEYYELKELSNTHYCSACGNILSLAYGEYQPGYYGYFIRCGQDKNHIGITRHNPRYDIKKWRYWNVESTALSKLTETQMLARVDMARFPRDLDVTQKKIIARIAIEYGLDPLMGELMIYQGNPYVRIDGRRRKAQETGELDGIATRPATKDEREARNVQDGDYLYKSEIRRKGSEYPFEGWGKVTKIEIDRAKAAATNNQRDQWFIPIVKDPGDMAEKRAEAEGLKRAFHLPLPSFEEIIGNDTKPQIPEPTKPIVQADAKDNQPAQSFKF